MRRPVSSIKADPVHQHFATGPFPVAPIPEWPEDFIRLVEHYTAKPFDPDMLRWYERIRAYMGYGGVPVPPALAAHRYEPEMPMEEPLPFAYQEPVSPASPISSTPAINAFDLGDD